MIFYHAKSIKDLKLVPILGPKDVPGLITKLGGDGYEWSEGLIGVDTRNVPVVAVLNKGTISVRTEMRTVCGASCAGFIHVVNQEIGKENRIPLEREAGDLKAAGKLVGIELLDYMVLYGADSTAYVSYRQRGLI